MSLFKLLAVPLLLAGTYGDASVEDVLEEGAKQFGRHTPNVAANKNDVKYIK